MAFAGRAVTMHTRPTGGIGRWGALLLCAVLAACSAQPPDRVGVAALPALQLDDRSVALDAVSARAITPDLLAINTPMREFVARYTAGIDNSRQRLLALHEAVQGAGVLGIRYDPFAEGTAQEVFARGSANCLSYANLFVALAREAGLDAHYQWLEVRPQWSRVGDRVLVGLHVNVVVKLHDGSSYMVDIDPLPARDIAGSQEISDRDAAALYHGNIAMDALAAEEVEAAWLHAVRALQLSPDMSHLWVNLGAIYRQTGQYRAAEDSYLQALALDQWQFSAMSNLALLYERQGREAEQSYWQERVEGYRRNNPYYYAGLGDEAAAAGDWQAALEYYQRAVRLNPENSQLLFARSLIYYQLDNLEAAAADLKRAIEHATLRSDLDNYQWQLEQLRRAGVAGTRD